MNEPDLLLIDVNGLGYAAMYQPNLAKLEHQGFSTAALHGALMSVFMRMGELPKATPLVIWDGRAQWRHDMYPGYKANRKDDESKKAIRDAYALQVPWIQLILNRLGIPQVRCASAEADDIAGVLCRELDSSWSIELNSKDTDWYQALAENVTWYSPTSRKRVTLQSLADPNNGLDDGHFVDTWEYLQAKALAGDTSDAIDGVQGVGLKTAVKIMRASGGSLESFWASVDGGKQPSGVVASRVAEPESRAIFERNIKLMDWRHAPGLDAQKMALTACKTPDWDDVQGLCEQFGLSRVLTRARGLMGDRPVGWGAALDAVQAALDSAETPAVIKP